MNDSVLKDTDITEQDAAVTTDADGGDPDVEEISDEEPEPEKAEPEAAEESCEAELGKKHFHAKLNL